MSFHEILAELCAHSDEYVRSLAITHRLREPLLNRTLSYLEVTPGSLGIDLGCGVGLPAIVAASTPAIHPRIVGVDVREDFIKIAQDNAARLGLEAQLAFQREDVTNLSCASDHFDWAWSIDCVRYAPSLDEEALAEIIRVLRPGGVVALMAWSSQTLLPGFPELETRLNTTDQGLAPFQRGMSPDQHFFRTNKALRAAGFEGVRGKTFVQDLRAPLSQEIRAGLQSLFAMRWPSELPGMTEETRDQYQRLIDPHSEDFILDNPDYYGFYTYTLFTGRKPI